jgi:cytosine/adenosine deaminase-related metal-dependent hydrolase
MSPVSGDSAGECGHDRALASVTRTLLEGGWIVTMDDAGTEHPDGWVLLAGGAVEAVGSGPPPDADEVLDLEGSVVTPGLVNVHHHLCQTLTRARAQESSLFAWFDHLLPTWKRLDAEAEFAAARTGLAELALSGCSTVFDHHYLFPPGADGLIEAEVAAAAELGVRIVAGRGAMDFSESQGGVVPDDIAEDRDDILADTERLIALHEAGPGAMVQIAVAPEGVGSATPGLISDSIELARKHGLRLHTHLAENVEEELYSVETFGRRPADHLADLGFFGADAWCAHCVRVDESDVARLAASGTGVAHCPTSNLRLGCGIAPVRTLLDNDVAVGLGVDGTASNERGDLLYETKQALLIARSGGDPAAMSCRQALRLATRGGAKVLGRDELGSLEPGKSADLAVWRTDGLELGGADDLVAGLVLSAPHRVHQLYVGGRLVVDGGSLVRADEQLIAREHRVQALRFSERLP